MNTLRPSTKKDAHEFYITLKDGTKIQGFSVTQTVCFLFQKIGVERVASFAMRNHVGRKGFPFVSKKAYDIPGKYPYVKVDGYNVIRTISADNWQPFLETMSDDLRLGIRVHYIKNK